MTTTEVLVNGVTFVRQPAKTPANKMGGVKLPTERSINVPLPEDLHRAFKVAAASRGLTVKEAVLDAISAWTIDNELAAQLGERPDNA
jgi:hypothetical protein